MAFMQMIFRFDLSSVANVKSCKVFLVLSIGQIGPALEEPARGLLDCSFYVGVS